MPPSSRPTAARSPCGGVPTTGWVSRTRSPSCAYGFTDHVFAACSILGYAFVPRIRDLPSKRLYVFERAGVPKRLRPLVGGKVNV